MARCGCAAQCQCRIDPCPDGSTTVAGNGSQGNPYVICAAPTILVEDDTPTVDMHVTEGPDRTWTIGADVIVSPDPDNCLEPRANGLYAPCDIDPVVVSTDGSIGVTVSGSDQLGDPTTYDLAAIPVPLFTLDTPCIDLSGAGTVGDPLVAVPIIGPEPNGLECGPNGLTVPPSSDAGNSLGIGADGRLFVPPGAGTAFIDGTGSLLQGDGSVGNPYNVDVLPGCGLVQEPDGLAADVAVWPFACPQDANAGDVYCSPTTGQLQTAPPPISITDRVTGAAALGTALNNTPATNLINFNLTNPDPCRPMRFSLTLETGFNYIIAPNTDIRVIVNNNITGNILGYSELPYRGTNSQSSNKDITDAWEMVLGPGASVNIQTGIDVDSPNYVGGNVGTVAQALTYHGTTE